jgi:hypothetical protein
LRAAYVPHPHYHKSKAWSGPIRRRLFCLVPYQSGVQSVLRPDHGALRAVPVHLASINLPLRSSSFKAATLDTRTSMFETYNIERRHNRSSLLCRLPTEIIVVIIRLVQDGLIVWDAADPMFPAQWTTFPLKWTPVINTCTYIRAVALASGEL